jgi:hypothetical protein
MGGTEQDVSKRRDRTRKSDCRTEEISLKVRAGAADTAVSAIEIGSEAKKGDRFIGAGKFPAVEVGMIVGGGDRADGSGTKNCGGHRNGGVNERVAAEKLKAVLGTALRKYE